MAEAEAKKATKSKTTAQVVKSYFAALAARDLEAATALWKPGAMDRLHGLAELKAPGDIKAYFAGLYDAFPDFELELLELAASGKNAAGRWRLTGTFLGPGRFQGLAPTGSSVTMEGCDMFQVEDGLIVENNAYTNGAQLAQQLGLLPAQGSAADRAVTNAFNAKTAAAAALRKFRER